MMLFASVFARGAKGKLTRGKFGGFRRNEKTGTTTLVGKKFDSTGTAIGPKKTGIPTLAGDKSDSTDAAIGPSKEASTANILARGFTAVSIFGEIGKGFAQARALKSQGRALEFQARQISLQGQREAINESIRANVVIGSQTVSSPTSLTGSSAGGILSEFEDSRTNRSIIRLSAEARSLLARDAANKARRRAKEARIGGFISAAQEVPNIIGSFFGK